MFERRKKGFTLVELITVIAILGIVMSTIIVSMQFSNRTFANSNLRANIQSETHMAIEALKREVGFAKNVVVRDNIPSPLAIEGGYCYYDSDTQILVLKTRDGYIQNLLVGLPNSTTRQIEFAPVAVGGVNSIIRCNWDIGGYQINTDIYVQNMKSLSGSVSPDYSTGIGIFIEFD